MSGCYWSLTLYEHANGERCCIWLAVRVDDLSSRGFNDRTSSY